MDEDSLMRQAADGDAAAFGRLVTAYQARVVRVAVRLLDGDTDAAQDAGQEVFLRLWRGRAQYQPRGCFAAFLWRIVRTVCWAARRRDPAARASLAASERVDDARPPVAEAVQGRALAAAVRAAVARLPEAQRVVFVLSHYEGLSYAEIADVLECPLGTVASRKRLAVETLRRALAAWDE